jgi:hypothetical protein
VVRAEVRAAVLAAHRYDDGRHPCLDKLPQPPSTC